MLRSRERARSIGPWCRIVSATPLSVLGDRDSGTARLEEAIVCYRAALTEFVRERVPLKCNRPVAAALRARG